MPNGQRWGTELRRGDVRLPYSPATRSGLPIEDIVAGCEGEESNGLFSSRCKSLKGGRKLASQASLVSFCACPVPTDRFLAYPACHTWRPLFPCMSSVTAALDRSTTPDHPQPTVAERRSRTYTAAAHLTLSMPASSAEPASSAIVRLGRPASNTAGNCHQMQCDCVSDRQSTRRSVPARRDLRLHCIVSTRAAAWPRRLCSACLVVSPVRPRSLLSMPSCSIMPWPHQTLMYEIIGDWPKPEARATCLQACWWLSKRLLNPTASLTVVVVVCVRVCVCV